MAEENTAMEETAELTEKSEEMAAYSNCGVCNAHFQDTTPKLLPCLHSFCVKCLEDRLLARQQEDRSNVPSTSANISSQKIPRLKCPTCGQEFLVPTRGIAGFLDNQFILESMEKLGILQGETSEYLCTSCEDNSAASSYCVNCTEWLCEACVQAHQRVRVTKDHSIQSKEEFKANECVQRQRPLFCQVHPNEHLKLFCANCEKLTCRDCQLLEHKDHKYQFVSEAATRYRALFRNQLGLLSEQTQPLVESIRNVENAAKALKDKEEVIITEIRKSSEMLIRAIKQRESVLITELKALVHFKQKMLAKQNKDLHLMQRILKHNHKFAMNAVKKGSDVALLYSKKQLGSRIQNLLSLKYNVTPVAHGDLRFVTDAEKLSNYIAKVGSVITPADSKTAGAVTTDVQRSGAMGIPVNSLTNALIKRTVETGSSITQRVPPLEALSAFNKRITTASSTTTSIHTVAHATSANTTQFGMSASTGSRGTGVTIGNATIMNGGSSSLNQNSSSKVGNGTSIPLQHPQLLNTSTSAPTRPLSRDQALPFSGTSASSGTLSHQSASMKRASPAPAHLAGVKRTSPAPARTVAVQSSPVSSPIKVKQERMDTPTEETVNFKTMGSSEDTGSGESGIDDGSNNDDWCAVCRNGGELLCCDTCPRVFHLQCHVPLLSNTPSGNWVCGLCRQLDTQNLNKSDHCPVGNKRRASAAGLSDLETKICEKILLELFCHADSIPFQQKVSKGVPNYYKIIQHPMDLSTIKTKLQPQHFQHYESIKDFILDCRIIFKNCAVFNGESEVGKMGKNLELYFDNMLKKYLPNTVDYSPPGKKRREELSTATN